MKFLAGIGREEFEQLLGQPRVLGLYNVCIGAQRSYELWPRERGARWTCRRSYSSWLSPLVFCPGFRTFDVKICMAGNGAEVIFQSRVDCSARSRAS